MNILFEKRFQPKLASVILFLCFFFLGCDPATQDVPEPLATIDTQLLRGEGPGRPVSANHNKALATVRQATVHFKKLAAAEAAGYTLASPCVASPVGGMGYHYVNGALLFDGTIDPSQPEALVFEPQSNGTMQLVAVEFIVDAASWDANHSEPPVLGDQVFDSFLIVDETNPLGFPHYQLHAWVWKHNPLGMHAPFNPNVSCAYAPAPGA